VRSASRPNRSGNGFGAVVSRCGSGMPCHVFMIDGISLAVFAATIGHGATLPSIRVGGLRRDGALPALEGSSNYLPVRQPLCGGSRLLQATWAFGIFR
jgi:hypothetical protein